MPVMVLELEEEHPHPIRELHQQILRGDTFSYMMESAPYVQQEMQPWKVKGKDAEPWGLRTLHLCC